MLYTCLYASHVYITRLSLSLFKQKLWALSRNCSVNADPKASNEQLLLSGRWRVGCVGKGYEIFFWHQGFGRRWGALDHERRRAALLFILGLDISLFFNSVVKAPFGGCFIPTNYLLNAPYIRDKMH